jgi:iron complex outermembrane recepter protein
MNSIIQTAVGRLLRPRGLAAIAVALATGPTLADQQSAAGQGTQVTLEEIVVTAQFREQNLQDTPLAITAVNAATMEARNQTSLHDLSQEAPNVSLVETGGAFGPGMTATIRGIGQGDFDPAFAPGVGIYIDDVYYTSLTGSNFDLVDLDRVEILRGPQGTLSGANSEGGSIKLYSVKPQGDDSGSLKVSYGERNLMDFQGMGDISLIPDTLFMRVSGVSHQQDGYVTRVDYGCAFPKSGIKPVGGLQSDCIAGYEGGKDYHGGRVAFRWLPADNFEANLTADITIDKSETAAVTLLAANPVQGTVTAINSGFPPGNPYGIAYDSRFIPSNPYVSYASFCAVGAAAGPPPAVGPTYCFSTDTSNKQYGTNLTLDWKLAPDLAVKSITGFREFDTIWTEDNDVSPLSGSLGAEHLLNHTLTQELRLNGKLDSLLDYTVGGFYLDQTTTYPTHQILDYIFPGSFEFLADDPIHEKDYAGFVNGTWHIVEGLDLNAGGRYTHLEKDYTYARYNPSDIGGGIDNASFAGLTGTKSTFTGHKFDYRVDLDYRWNPELMTYASVSTGFKGGGSNPRPFIVGQAQPFGTETLTNYEIGAKSDWLNHTLRFNVSGYYAKYKDIQLVPLSCPQYSQGATFPFTPETEPCAAPINGGSANIYGVEVESEYRLGALSVDGSFSRQHFEYTSVDASTGIPIGGTEPAFVPVKFSVGAQYDVHMPFGATISPRADFSYSAGYQTLPIPDAHSYLPGYHNLNARLTYRPDSGKWDVAVVGTNLADKLWYTQIFDLYAAPQSGADYGIPAPPRTIWVEFKKRF